MNKLSYVFVSMGCFYQDYSKRFNLFYLKSFGKVAPLVFGVYHSEMEVSLPGQVIKLWDILALLLFFFLMQLLGSTI